jgi:hypothetical protein
VKKKISLRYAIFSFIKYAAEDGNMFRTPPETLRLPGHPDMNDQDRFAFTQRKSAIQPVGQIEIVLQAWTYAHKKRARAFLALF